LTGAVSEELAARFLPPPREFGESMDSIGKILACLGLKQRAPLDRYELAAVGEEAAARWLKSQGYAILERNYAGRGGEIDIIAKDREGIVFVEVKARTSEAFGRPSEGVSRDKQRKLVNTAESYLVAKVKREEVWRLDIAEVLLDKWGRVEEINIIEGAFRP